MDRPPKALLQVLACRGPSTDRARGCARLARSPARYSFVHVAEQPSPGAVPPSSHCSVSTFQ